MNGATMWVFGLLLIFYFPTHRALIAREYSEDLLQTLYGNLTSMDDLFDEAEEAINANHDETIKTEKDDDDDDDVDGMLKKYRQKTFKMPEVHEEESNETSHDHIDQEYQKITKIINNITRRFEFGDLDDTTYGQNIEYPKIQKIRKVMIQFIIHTRHELAKCFRQREQYRRDKRFKIGYLFNRLRRIKTEQLKIIWTVYSRKRSIPEQTEYIDDSAFQFSLIMYEKVAAYDVDIRDTVRFIKDLAAVKDRSDYLIPK